MLKKLKQMADLAIAIVRESPTATELPHLTIWHSRKPAARGRDVDPKFYLLVQGEKRMQIGGRTFDFAVGSCAVSAVNLPFSS